MRLSCSMLSRLTLCILWWVTSLNCGSFGEVLFEEGVSHSDSGLSGKFRIFLRSATFILAVASPTGSPNYNTSTEKRITELTASLNNSCVVKINEQLVFRSNTKLSTIKSYDVNNVRLLPRRTSLLISRCFFANWRAFSWLPSDAWAFPSDQQALPSPMRSARFCAIKRCRRWYSMAVS